MFIAEPVGDLRNGWKASIFKAVNEPQNELLATVYGWNQSLATRRAEVVLKALQELEK